MLRSLLTAICLAVVMIIPAKADTPRHMMIELKSGVVKIALRPDLAPGHVDRVVTLVRQGAYDGIGFHRVIEGFMAQTGDVQFGKVKADGSVSPRVGLGGSDMPDLRQEFSAVPFKRAIVGAARGGHSVDSANSQFFIMLERAASLDGKYTVWGEVVEGMEHVDNIKKGRRNDNGKVTAPDRMIRVTVE